MKYMLSERMESKFSAYVVSNGSKEYYPENTLSKFSVKFPFSFDLPTNENEKWVISLNSIGLSSKFGSKYEKHYNEPLVIHIVNLTSTYICTGLTDAELLECKTTVKTRNEILKRFFNRCYYGEQVVEHCSPKTLSHILKVWKTLNLYFGELHQTNYYHNTLETAKDLQILIKQLIDDGIQIKQINEMKYEFSAAAKVSDERVLLIRKDFLDLCNFSQDTTFIDARQRNQHADRRLFRNIQHARELNDDTVNFSLGEGSHNYHLFVFNEEHKSLTLEIKKFMQHDIAVPNLIKIKCGNIRSQVFNNTHSNDIDVIKPVFDVKGSHYFHEFENPVFVPLLNSRLSDLNFELTDEYDEQLILKTGLPTIISATFKKMPADYKCFNIRITPNQDSPENTNSKFKNILPNTFTFNNNWCVGLKDITFPNQFKNLPTDENEIVIIKLSNDLKPIQNERYRIPISNTKSNLQDFIKHLNSKILNTNAFTFDVDTTDTVSIKAKTNVIVSISRHLAQLLGFLPLVFDSTQTVQNYWKSTLTPNVVKKASTPVNISLFRPAFLMVYLDFVELTLISGVYTNIVKIIPVKIEKDTLECQTMEFKNIEFRKLGKMIVSEINTEIRDPAGNLVQFDNDKLTLHLFFTNNPLN